MVIVLMGAAGAGKTTVGRHLSEVLQWEFVDGDALHSSENIAKMASGTSLTDEDRRPWLQALRKCIAASAEANAGMMPSGGPVTTVGRLSGAGRWLTSRKRTASYTHKASVSCISRATTLGRSYVLGDGWSCT